MDSTVVELFAGVGGFRCGFNEVQLVDGEVIEKDNWDFVWANQYEPSTKSQAAFDCYVERFGESENHVNEDIATVDKNNIPNHTLLVGGFPCQDYSVARSLSNEKGIEGKKGVLWWQIAEVLEAKRPPFVLLENVDRLLRSPSTQRGRDFGIMLRTFLDYGYSVEWRVINSADYGFPQKRRRVFIFAYHKNTNYYKKMNNYSFKDIIFNQGIFANTFPIMENELEFGECLISEKEFEDIVQVSDNFKFHFYNAGLIHNGKINTYKTQPLCEELTVLNSIVETSKVDDKYYLYDDKLNRMEYLKGSKKLKRKRPNGKIYYYSEGKIPFPDYLDKPARTILTSEGNINRGTHIIKDINGLRFLTPLEVERIQMFPDNWTNVKSKAMTERRRYFMMGNALVVGVVERLGKYLRNIVLFEK